MARGRRWTGVGAMWALAVGIGAAALAVALWPRPIRLIECDVPEQDSDLGFLERPEAQAALARIEPGTFVAITKGTLDWDADLDALLARVERAHPNAEQRYLFRRGDEGEKRYNATFVDHPWMGVLFLAAVEGTLSGDAREMFDFFRECRAKFPAPDGRPLVPVRLAAPGSRDAREIRFVFSTGSSCPLLVPEGSAWPRSEIPGEAVISLLGGPPIRCRRYLVRAAIPELGIDVLVEAIPLPNLPETRFFLGAPWRGLVAKGVVRLGMLPEPPRPVLLLTGDLDARAAELLEPSKDLLARFDLYFGGARTPTALAVRTGPEAEIVAAVLPLNAETAPEAVRRFLEAHGK